MKPSPELRELLLSLYSALDANDVPAIERLIASREDTLVIGTDPDEWWSGHEAIARAFRTRRRPASGAVRIGNPRAFCQGDVGWADDRVRLALPDGREVPMRFSFVFIKEDGAWQIIQWHASIGVPNEAATGGQAAGSEE